MFISSRTQPVIDKHQISIPVFSIYLSIDVKSHILQTDKSFLSSVEIVVHEVGFLEFPESPVMIKIIFPVLLTSLKCKNNSMNQLLMRVTHRHERIYFVISGHKYLFDLVDVHIESLKLELFLKVEPLMMLTGGLTFE